MSEQDFLAAVKSNQGIIFKLVGLYAADTEEKKDLYQEVLLQAWKSWPSFRGDAKFSTWLYRICLNTILTQKRKQKNINYQERLDEISPSVESAARLKEDSLRLQQAIRRLAETDRAIISAHLDGYNNGEIAEIMGIGLNHVSVKLHRIKQQLTTILK